MDNEEICITEGDDWKSMFDAINDFSDDFMEDREQPKMQTREGF